MEDYEKDCECKVNKRKMARYFDSGLPEEFKESKLSEFERNKPLQKSMYNMMISYLENFETIKNTNRNSLGMIAEFGEQSIKEIQNPIERKKYKKDYSSYGIGKTFLQAGATNHLIFKMGQTVKFVRDIEFMQKLQDAKFEDKQLFAKLFEEATRCDVLVWDDIGKAKASDAKQDIYLSIIDQRYTSKLPIMYSSNEDEDTLGDRIGGAALDRLIGMSKDYLLSLKGESYRRS